MKILNLYAGIGGNRKLWGNEHEVTAVEYDPYIADVYREMYPDDTVIVADAHQYLLDHGEEYDFIWSSPPCPTHSVTNAFLHAQGVVRYPDMSLYQEILWLKHRFKGLWVVENVKPYYKAMITPAAILDRHYFWSNFKIPHYTTGKKKSNVAKARASTRQTAAEDMESLESYHGIVLPESAKNRRKLLRNAVYPPMGLHVLQSGIAPEKTQRQLL